MSDSYTSNLTLAEAAQRIAGAKRVLLTTHAKPDGDAFGSVLALAQALLKLNHEVTAVVAPPVAEFFTKVRGQTCVQVIERNWRAPEVDLVIVLDTGAWSQLGELRAALEPRCENMLIIDHHLAGDVPAAWRYIDAQAAACCEIVAQFITQLQGARDLLAEAVISEALYLGIASDTGWFRFSNTRPATLELAARLLAHGVDHAELYALSEQSERPEKLQLLIRALDSLELLAEGRAAVMQLRQRDFVETGARTEETDRFVDVPQMVAGVQVVALLCEPAEGAGPIRVSLRSKPTPGAVNVSNLASRFGGGGHARAAGAKLGVPLSEATAAVKQAIEAELAGA